MQEPPVTDFLSNISIVMGSPDHSLSSSGAQYRGLIAILHISRFYKCMGANPHLLLRLSFERNENIESTDASASAHALGLALKRVCITQDCCGTRS